jgi:hypothetical protein
MSQPVQLSQSQVERLNNLKKPADPTQERIAAATERQAAAMESIASDLGIIRRKFEIWESIGDQD